MIGDGREPAPHWSLGYLLDHGYRLTIACPSGHSSDIDLARAIGLLGADLVLPEGRDRLLGSWRCRRCRQAGDGLTITPRDGR